MFCVLIDVFSFLRQLGSIFLRNFAKDVFCRDFAISKPISKIKNGDDAVISFSAIPNQNFKGIISEVAYSPVNGSTYPIVLRIDNPSPLIRPGMAADISFVFKDKKAIGCCIFCTKNMHSSKNRR